MFGYCISPLYYLRNGAPLAQVHPYAYTTQDKLVYGQHL